MTTTVEQFEIPSHAYPHELTIDGSVTPDQLAADAIANPDAYAALQPHVDNHLEATGFTLPSDQNEVVQLDNIAETTAGSQVEISPWHVGSHSALAEGVGASGFDRLPPKDQQRIGEVLEIGKLAEDTAFAPNHELQAEVEDSLGRAMLDHFVERASGDQAANRAAVDSLMARGARPEGLAKLIGAPENINKLHQQDGQSDEKYQASQDAIAQITGIEGLSFDVNEHAPSHVMDELIRDPVEYAKVIPTLKHAFEVATKAGYPAAQASNELTHVFSNYFGNSLFHYAPGEDVEDRITVARQNALNESGNAMALVGTSGLELQALTGGSRDPALEDMRRAIHNGVPGATSDVLSNVERARSSLTTLAEGDKDVYAAFKSFGVADGKLTETSGLASFAANISQRTELLDLLRVDGADAGRRYAARITKIIGLAYRDRRQDSEGYTNRLEEIDDMTAVMSGNTGISVDNLLSTFSGLSGPESSAAYKDFLLGNNFMAAVHDPATSAIVTSNYNVLAYYDGKYDFSRLNQAFTSVEDAPDYWYEDMVACEAGLSPSAQEYFYSDGMQRLHRRDKDGNFYDEPLQIGKMLEGYGTGDEALDRKVDWFKDSDLPAAAFGPVSDFRERALKEGIADTPKAIHEWIFSNQDFIKEMSEKNVLGYMANTTAHLNRMGQHHAAINGPAAEQLLADAKELAERRKDDYRMFVNVSTEVLGKMVTGDGNVKSVFSTEARQANRSESYYGSRSTVEVALGIRSLDDKADHAVYGTAGFITGGIPRGPVAYGEVMLTFKETPDLASRTTYTPEDSYHGTERLTAEDAKALRLIKTGQGYDYEGTECYVEAQVIGALNIQDAAEIVVLSDEYADNLRQVLPQDLHDKIVVRKAVMGQEDLAAKSMVEKAYRAFEAGKIEEEVKRSATYQPQTPPPGYYDDTDF